MDGPSKPRLLYATPTAEHPRIGYVASMRAISMSVKQFDHGPEDIVFTAGPVQMARCEIAKRAIERKYDYVLMHDDDLVVHHKGGSAGNPVDTYLALMEADPKVGIVGAVYLRETPRIPTINMWHPLARGTKDAPGETVTAVCNLPREAFEVAGVGTGFMLIKTKVFEDVAAFTGDTDPFLFWPYKTQWGSPAVIGEDFYFCWRAQQAGWKVLADPTVATVHEKTRSGPLEFKQYDWDPPDGHREHKVEVPPGACVIKVDGIDCIDVSEIRKRDGLAQKAA